jgi:hypothetical protein
MTIAERINNLPNLQYDISNGDEAAKEELKSLYKDALGKEMKRDCYSCRIRAYQELISLNTQQIKQVMSSKKFTLKDKDAVVYFDHQHYIASTFTDEVGYAMLKSNPENADLFESYPEDALQGETEDKYTAEELATAHRKGDVVYVTIDGEAKKLSKVDVKKYISDVEALPVVE